MSGGTARGTPTAWRERRSRLTSRIAFVCDAYHAMTNDRPYRRALSHEEAVAEIRAESGSQFCPTAAAALLDVLQGGAAGVRLPARAAAHA